MPSKDPQIAIIGAGWAGVAAALTLQDHGIQPTLYEAAPQAGGRAKTIARINALGRPLENGQHILLGAYHASLELIKRFHPKQDPFLRLPLHLAYLNQSFSLKTPKNLPAPLHLLWGILTTRGISFSEKMALLRQIQTLKQKKWQLDAKLSVAEWVANQSLTLRKKVWEPLCFAALNTRLENASAAIFARVLQDSFDQKKSDSDLIIPRTGLSELWLSPAIQQLKILTGQPITQFAISPENKWLIEGKVYDAVILACSIQSAFRILTSLDPHSSLLENLQAFQTEAIATAYVSFTKPLKLPYPIMALEETPEAIGQWVFDRCALMPNQDSRGDISIVCSVANHWIGKDKSECLRQLYQQVQEQLGQTLPPLLDAHWIVEKRATFQSTPDLIRPKNTTEFKNLYLAGDWTDTGYPAVLEGAVLSGQQAALQCLLKNPF